ncbi:MAG: hypothetical protein J6Y20_05605 [Lachnospiraceae bacterium]|nr:hypothetical protein [Lachnospiraceae bacterium]
MPRKTITLGPVATGFVVGGILAAGYLWGFYDCRKRIMDRVDEEDVFGQFVDILGDSDGIDEVWYE